MIGGDGYLQTWHGHDELSSEAAGEIAAYLDEPRAVYGVQMMAKAWRQARRPGLGCRCWTSTVSRRGGT